MVPFFVSVHAHISENVCEIWRPIWQTRTTRCIDIAITFAKRISLKYCQQSPIHSKNYRFYYGLAASTQHIDRRYDFSYKRHMYYSTHSTPHRTHAVVKLCFFSHSFCLHISLKRSAHTMWVSICAKCAKKNSNTIDDDNNNRIDFSVYR